MPFSIIRKFCFKSIFYIIFISNILIGQAQNLRFTHLTTDDGLSKNNISKIIQDKNGFIWIGSFTGLTRYDGYNFINISLDSNNSTNNLSHHILDILEDSHGIIWIGIETGLIAYDTKTEKNKKYIQDDMDEKSLSHSLVYKIFEDKDGIIWVGTMNGLNKFDRKNDNFKVFIDVAPNHTGNEHNSVVSIEEDDEGNLWLGTWDGLTKMSKNGEILQTFFNNPTSSKDFDFRKISAIFNDGMGNLWIGMSRYGLKKYNQKSGVFTDYYVDLNDSTSISNGYITSITKDNYNRLWIGTLFGLQLYDYKKDNFKAIYNDPNISYSLLTNQVSSLLLDNSGLLWIGTSVGISKYSTHINIFEYYRQNENSLQLGLCNSNAIDCFVDHNDDIWVGTMEGVTKIESKTGKFTHLLHDPNNPNSLSENFVRRVYFDKDEILWVATNSYGLNRYNPKTGKWKHYLYDINDFTTISNSGVVSLIEDSKGYLWMGTWWGVNRFDKKNEKFTRFEADKQNPSALQNPVAWDIFEDSKGKLWFATDGGGLSLLNKDNVTFTHFTDDSSNQNYINSKKVYTIYETSDGLMWFGTPNGLNCYNREDGKTVVYNRKNGLSGNIINGIIEGNDGNLWIATNMGLTKFNRKENKFTIYNDRNGLKSNTFAQNVAQKSSDGKLYFASYGVCSFYPEKLAYYELNANLVITDFKIFNQTVIPSNDGILSESISTTKSITIPPGNEVITFEFALLDYYNVNQNVFRYKLEGFDSDWNYIGNLNVATYTNLSPGKYKFLVNGSNTSSNNKWIKTALEIIIIPKFYQQVIFQVFVFLMLIFCLVYYIKYRTKKIENLNKELEQKVIVRTLDLAKKTEDLNQEIATKDKFFSIIAHDLRSPFMALLGFSKHLVDDLESLSKEDIHFISSSINKSASHTFGLLQNLLQWARIQTGTIDYKPTIIEMKSHLTDIKELNEGNAQNKEIKLILNIEDDCNAFADKNMIEFVTRNLISNAIKFTNKKGEIVLSLSKKNDLAKVSIKDNGVGMPKEKTRDLFYVGNNSSTSGTDDEPGTGLGLILCKEFLGYNKGQIFVKSDIGKGTEISYTLPTKQN